MLTDVVVGGLAADIESALDEPDAEGAPQADTDALRALAADLERLGWFGILVAASASPAPEQDFFDDIAGGLRKGLAGEDADRAEALEALIDRAAAQAAGTERSPRRVIAEALYEHFALDQHSLFVEDVERVLELLRTGGAQSDTKGYIRGLTRLSSDSARFIVGLFPGNLELIYAIGNRTAERQDIDAVFEDFGPPAIWKRLPAIMNALIQKDKRFRLAVTLWARLHGVDIKPEQVQAVSGLLETKTTKPLLEALVANAEKRAAILRFQDAQKDAHAAIHRALDASGPTP
jgi:hypothetical protein